MRKLRRWKKIGLALIALAFLLPLLAFVLSNLFLLSPKGRKFVAARIARVLPLETSVSGATWSPWNGITLHGLRLEQPAPLRAAVRKPLLTIQTIRIHPDWRKLLRKNLSAKGIEIVKADLTLPVELLSQIPRKETAAPVAAANPDLASAPPQQIPAPQAAPPPPAEIPPTPPPVAAAQQKPTVAAMDVKTPTVWVSLKGVGIRIVSGGSHNGLCEATGINGSIPISGKPAKSAITIARMAGLGKDAPGSTKLPIAWKSPVIAIGPAETELFGLDLKVVCNAALIPGIPFKVEALVPEQKGKQIRIGPENKATLGAVTAQGMFQGYLQVPATWQGQWVAQALSVDAELAGGRRTHFERGQALAVFGNGMLRCLDARLIGDDASFLANATLLTDGRLAGNARFVASPETLSALSKFTRPQTAQPPAFTALSTPQRAALDIQVFGRIGELFYKPDPASAPLRLR